MHIAHHLVNQGALGGRAVVGLLIEEVAVEAIVIHDLNQLVRHREGAVRSLLDELPDLLHIAVSPAPGEAQGRHHRHAVCVGGIGEFPGGAAHQAFLGAGPVYEGSGILPVIEGIAQEGFCALGAGVVMVRVGQGAEHQLCLRVHLGVHHEAANPVRQGNAGPAVDCIRVRLRRPLQ